MRQVLAAALDEAAEHHRLAAERLQLTLDLEAALPPVGAKPALGPQPAPPEPAVVAEVGALDGGTGGFPTIMVEHGGAECEADRAGSVEAEPDFLVGLLDRIAAYTSA